MEKLRTVAGRAGFLRAASRGEAANRLQYRRGFDARSGDVRSGNFQCEIGAGAVTAVPPIDGLFAGLADLTQIADYAVHRAIKQKAAFQNGGPMLLHVIGEIFARLFHDLEAEAVDEHKASDTSILAASLQ